MAKYAPAIQKPVTRYQPGGSVHTPMPKPGRLCFHTAVSSGDSLFGLFNTPGNAVAHFYIRQDGKVEQYVDTDTRASANLDGNDDTISVESWDNGAPGGQVPDWTPAQTEAAAKLAAWVHDTHGIPLDPCDAHPGSRGVTWHRKGIDGNFPTGLLSGRGSGDEHWSNAAGKTCPGDKKIHGVVDKILPRARQLLTNGDDMQLDDDLYPADDTKDTTIGAALRQADGIDAKFVNLNTELDTKFAAVNGNVNGFQKGNATRLDAIEKTLGELVEALKP
jgi:hypothetical protein